VVGEPSVRAVLNLEPGRRAEVVERRLDGLAAIVDWVEKGAAPSRIEASARPGTPYFPGRTRPLCAYPSYARYTGSGSLEDGTNFTCVAEAD